MTEFQKDAGGNGSILSFAALRQDLRFAGRMLVKSPLFTGIVVVTLALGIGLNTAVFAAVEALLLRPLPGVRATSELVQVYRTWPGPELYGSNSVPHFWDVRARSKEVFSGAASWSFEFVSLTADARPSLVFAQMVSADYFDVLGVTTTHGRFFRPEEDEGRGAHPVVVLSDAGWKSLFGAAPDIVGREVPLNGQNVTIVGVAPPEFKGAMPMVQPTLWIPLMQMAQVRPGSARNFENRGNNNMNIVARLKPGVTVEQAKARMDALTLELRAEFPDDYEDSGIHLVKVDDAGIHPMFRSAQVGLSAVVMVVVGILLLIACVNVANLFLARARDRAREMAIRLALGAQRAALVRQLLVESLCFALVSGVAGLLVAVWAIGLTNRIRLPIDIDFAPELRLSPTVLLFALGATVLTGVIFGLAPALQATRPALIPALKGEAPAGEGRSRAAKGLVVTQMALSIVLLVCAGLFLTNLRSATALDKGFVADHLLLADVDPGLQGYARGNTEQFYRALAERLREHPDVRAVSMTDNVPLGVGGSDRGVEIPGYTPSKNEGMSINYASVGPGYFDAMGIPLRAGREFKPEDDTTSVRALVVNERFVERFWPGQEAIGKTVRTAGRDYTIVGVVTTGKYQRLGEDPRAFMWFPQLQVWSAGMSLVIRTGGDPEAMIPALREAVAQLDANLPISNVRTMDKHLGISLLPARVTGAALGVFGILGLLLASVGMYGVMAYSVSQRTREIGIRMAIGAAASDVIGLVMRQGLTLVLVGTVIGLGGAFAAARLLAGVLYGGNALDPMTFTLVPLVLIAVAAVATFAPARRAAAVDPAITLRAD
jgi:predicted permease